ncbi:MAG: M20/M25/M40 family metallo-hydrolase [Planctomycetota bacterium]|jgi:Zn-dependent M28 family amino/carboxypeptidase|nr:M20/M25/M40 family metallo-hydrolase [Planctomycetota bacterium]
MKLDTENRIVEEIESGSEAWENLLVLADDIGIRVAGSSGEMAARDFLLDKLNGYGLDDVHSESFPHRAWRPVREELHLVAPYERAIACRCGGLSPSTPDEGIEGEVVLLERCDREELESRQEEVRGRFVVAPYYPFARQLKTPLAARYGAIGLLEHRNYAGGLQPARTCVFARTGDIPVASISLEDAEFLRRLQQRKSPVRLRLSLDSRIERKDSWNVVGQLTGSERPDEFIVTGGHYDSWHVGPGANDNAAGVVAVVEAARALAKFRKHLPCTVRFVLFGVEESGLVGSWAYTREHQAELDDVLLMINNDVGGRPRGIGISGFDDLLPALQEVAARVKVEGLEEDKPFHASAGGFGWGSDHFPFVAQGVPTIGIGTSSVIPEDRLYGHSRADTAEKVYPRGLSECAAINAQIIHHVANLEQRPARRKSRDEVEKMIHSLEFMETLELLDVWPPEHVFERYFSFGS